MARIRKRGGRYNVEWRPRQQGKPGSRTFGNLSAAREFKLEVENALARGVDWEPSATGDEPSIEEVYDAYLAHRRLRKRAGTMKMDGMYMDVFVRFAATKSRTPTITLLSRPLLDEYMEWLSRPETSVNNRKRKGLTIRRLVSGVQQMWRWAENSDRWTGHVPRPRLLDLDEMPDSSPQPVVAATLAEVDACIHALRKRSWLRKLAVFLRFSGLRVGETMQLLRSDLNKERGELTIRPEIDKMKMGRVIPLHPSLLAEMETWHAHDIGEDKDEYLIPTRRYGSHSREARPRDIASGWRRAKVREAVWKQRPYHAFRRAFKSALLELGASADGVDFLQGHKLGSGSRGRYIDARALKLRETLALLPAIASPSGNVITLPKRHADRLRTNAKR